jgi:hypothetical protein
MRRTVASPHPISRAMCRLLLPPIVNAAMISSRRSGRSTTDSDCGGSGDDRGGSPATATSTAKSFDEAGVADLEKGLREQPWMEGYLRAIGVNPRTGPMPLLSPAETRCREIIQRGGAEGSDVWKQELNGCVADLRQEWLDSR